MVNRRPPRSRPPPQRQNGEKGQNGFPKLAKMATAKSQMDLERQRFIKAAEAGYLGSPPPDPDLLQVTLVKPGKHLLPRDLDQHGSLNQIRRKHKVWIQLVQENVFEIRGESIRRLQQATKDVNWAIHDMRLSDENLTTRFMVQKPACGDDSALIKMELGSRPRYVAGANGAPGGDVLSIAFDDLCQLRSSLVPSTDILWALRADLKMRVNFGRLQVSQRKKEFGSDISYTDFARIMPQYSIRGGATMDTRLSDVHVADKVIRHLMDPAVGILYHEEHQVQRRYNIVLRIQDEELVAEAQAPSGNQTQLSAARMTRPEKWPRLNWTMAAPDMKLDWNLQVDSCGTTACVPADLQALVGSIVLMPDGAGGSQAAQLKPPRVLVTGPRGGKVDETLLNTCMLVPFRDAPFVVEVSVTQAWCGMETTTTPETWWGMAFYGLHWDEAINHVSPGERRKDWGAGLRGLWPGNDASLEARFMEFLEHVVEIQSALGEVDFQGAGGMS